MDFVNTQNWSCQMLLGLSVRYFFFPCLSLLIYIWNYLLTNKLKIIQNTEFFESKTVDYSRRKGLDQHCIVDIVDITENIYSNNKNQWIFFLQIRVESSYCDNFGT
jgi:hypothetical protein